ncbi:long-chain fatty acid transporter [Alcanivorax hongdengensis A-11-3]|uniref:Long-chain fatty acid transporter n=1 Tax=Alcanivorax hongdengensis A-11-3 TaxID=1177179 RepID=L0WDH3_9GAMM|nr:outer membrane protein transport protein [Alcanivorax hongdengensis]EKF74197.1 long-chain fatty acid transporter [Alcanivorax hongdengensis A-11-3]
MKMKTHALLIGSAISLAAGQAMATGFAVSEQSVSAQGTAYAGAAALSENASNQWFNPATLAGLKKAEITAAVQQVIIDTSFKSNGASGPGDFKDLDPVVGSAFLALPLSDMMTFGLGINAPFGTKIEYEDNWGNVATDGLAALSPTTGDRYATMSDLKTYNVNPALGIQVTDNLNVGVGLSYQRIDADIESAFTRLEGDDDSYGWNIGLTFDADDNNHFGLAYRSKVEYDIDGDITFSPLPLIAQGTPPATANALAGKYNGSTSLDMPASAQFSYAGDLSDRTQILFGVEWMEWSSLDKLVIKHDGAPIPSPVVQEFDWGNTTRYSAGVRHTLASDTVLRFGVYKEDSTQNSDNRSPTSPDSDKIGVSLGAGFNPTDNMTVDVVYSHLFVDDADTNLTERGVLNGSYELDADVIGAQLSYRF